MSIGQKSIIVVILVLAIDQFSKIFIKLNFALGDHVEVFSWFQIFFVENNGMAFGMEIIGKLFLTLFRIIAVSGLVYFILLAVSLLLAGAAGNIFDSLFYGILFSDSYGMAATFLPETGGYAPVFYGKVVDMLYFPLIKNSVGETIFFRPVFNIADSAIFVSVCIILLFYRKDFNESMESKKNNPIEDAA
jgi:signal peptidase II